MLCAAATSGASCNLLSKLRERRLQDKAWKSSSITFPLNGIADNTNERETDEDSVSSAESDGNMTVTSVSTIGNIVGGMVELLSIGRHPLLQNGEKT